LHVQISALEIERILLECPEVHEIAVFGVADPVWVSVEVDIPIE